MCQCWHGLRNSSAARLQNVPRSVLPSVTIFIFSYTYTVIMILQAPRCRETLSARFFKRGRGTRAVRLAGFFHQLSEAISLGRWYNCLQLNSLKKPKSHRRAANDAFHGPATR